jgi:hypothetical protein
MKRFVIFAALGPLIGFVTVMALLQGLDRALGAETPFEFGQLVLLPAAYVIGFAPAMIVAVIDHAFRDLRYRVLWTTLSAYLAGFLPILTALLAGFVHGPYLLVFGLIGAVPGAICSWLSGDRSKASADA